MRLLGNTNHVMNEILPRLRAEVDKHGGPGTRKGRVGAKVSVGDGGEATEEKKKACVIM